MCIRDRTHGPAALSRAPESRAFRGGRQRSLHADSNCRGSQGQGVATLRKGGAPSTPGPRSGSARPPLAARPRCDSPRGE
eukprot:9623513-Alexandrium_andersonii.AAC.1